MATNNAINIATAASGKVLQGAGVGSSPTFSTATYPSTAGSTGTILRADGTNWAASTATYPNTAGSSGNVLTSDGTNWTSSAPAGGGVTSVSGTANRITSTGGSTPVIDISASYVGQTSITTLGTITSGTWTGTTIAVANGGTGRTTLTNHGVLVGAAASAITQLAAGSSGQVLQSGGASADPAYSTATYPATATGTGKILRADGTNWVATTATFPDTAGTSGNVLTSDGTNWSSSAPAAGTILTASGSLTSTQIKACHASPVQLIAAPGSGKYIYIIGWTSTYKYGGTNVFTAAASQTVKLYYGTATAVNSTSVLASNANLVGTTSTSKYPAPPYDVALATNAFDNVAINAYNSVATEISGNAANDNTINYYIQYIIAND
jgi:hypothetical protein